MKCYWSGKVSAVVVAILVTAGLAQAQTSIKLTGVGGATLSPDTKTLILSVPASAKLFFFDTLQDKEIKQVELDFQPTLLAAQGDKLFAVSKGSAIVHVLDGTTGKETKSIKVPGEPFQALACNPTKGLVYGVNSNNEVYAIDPAKGTSNKTKAKGQLIAIDAADGKFVYTGIQKPIMDTLVFEEGPGGKVTVSMAKANLRALMLKYSVDGEDLKLVAVNDNAAINGRGMGLSPDGTKVAMAGGGGWRSKTDPKANYSIAVFETKDMQTQLGQIETGPYPAGITFHPVLNVGAAYRDRAELVLFNGKSFVKKETYKLQHGSASHILLFGGQGTKVIYCALNAPDSVLEFLPIPLTDEDKETLKKTYSK